MKAERKHSGIQTMNFPAVSSRYFYMFRTQFSSFSKCLESFFFYSKLLFRYGSSDFPGGFLDFFVLFALPPAISNEIYCIGIFIFFLLSLYLLIFACELHTKNLPQKTRKKVELLWIVLSFRLKGNSFFVTFALVICNDKGKNVPGKLDNKKMRKHRERSKLSCLCLSIFRFSPVHFRFYLFEKILLKSNHKRIQFWLIFMSGEFSENRFVWHSHDFNELSRFITMHT